jgi:predicted nucleotidyltransferase
MQKTLKRDDVLKTLQRGLPHLKEKYGVVKIALFGSFARGTAGKASDVDLLVQLERPLGLEFVELANYIEELLGRPVDIATFDCWRRGFAQPRYRPIAEDVERSLLYV